MSKIHQKPILNASLPAQFRQLRLVLAREPGHPEGDAEVAYVFVAPLDPEDRIDRKPLAKISRCLPGRASTSGRARPPWVSRSPAGRRLGYSTTTTKPIYPDEVGYHFADERFIVGEYVSINEARQDAHLPRDARCHTFVAR